jgi:hypothetical protein
MPPGSWLLAGHWAVAQLSSGSRSALGALPVHPSCLHLHLHLHSLHWCWCACSGHLLLGAPTQRVKRQTGRWSACICMCTAVQPQHIDTFACPSCRMHCTHKHRGSKAESNPSPSCAPAPLPLLLLAASSLRLLRYCLPYLECHSLPLEHSTRHRQQAVLLLRHYCLHSHTKTIHDTWHM